MSVVESWFNYRSPALRIYNLSYNKQKGIYVRITMHVNFVSTLLRILKCQVAIFKSYAVTRF